ncbi:guanyl-nucleotide exchange factor [Metarhizium album ARSEF 1941]|uniref:Guanyl-nucleotide exchange factor n=1 Tax=Metarhizium album (strain ARSEF 1941) TaxID=1081103 RepID=A0A0B2X620_METAS|nr:guanyl-nucleotide exchange factor [Metarhizium album ARSEF 1941]KHO00910.1 guanyl-nucleotide exchange factor [Metarhizium album ARSEF 1941]
MASETDIRRHAMFNVPRPSDDDDDDDDADKAALSSEAQSIVPGDPYSLSKPETRQSEPPEHTSVPPTSESEQRQNKFHRFSILRYRNASDSQLSLRAKKQAEVPPPIPRPPAIITTAPTNDIVGPKKVSSRMSLAAKFRRSNDIPRSNNHHVSVATMRRGNHFADDRDYASTVESYNRQSESSRSDASSGDHASYSSPATTPKKPSSSTPFFKLRKAKKPPEPLFPLAHLQQKNLLKDGNLSSASLGTDVAPRPASSHSATTPQASNGGGDGNQMAQSVAASALFARGGGQRSGQSSPTRTNLLRGRSSTMSSAGRDSTDDHLLPPTARTSTSTGRKSFGDLFGLGRIRQNSELSRQGTLTPGTPGSITSKSNSLQLPRDSLVLPERQGNETPAKYLARLEGVVSRGIIASALSKGTDPFSAAVLRSYMRSFSFFGDPMDMAIRKLLMEAELPKETQQIDRCLQAFANRYHECNPGIYSSPDQAYFIAFSLLILHTDVFNKNNKHKMQKSDYLKNTRGEGIFDEILECFYDNISYTPFIHVEDDLDPTNDRMQTHKSKKKLLLSANGGDPSKRAAKEPIDPYTLILDGNLDALRPNLKEAMHLDDHYNYLGTATSFNLKDLQNTFFKTGVLQIVSPRSRPDAFMSEKTATNPNDAHPGIVDIKVTKVGLLWRKDAKKRKTRSPWQEWGAILTGAQLYFFRNTSWVKNLIHQYEGHIKSGHDGIPIIFKPPLEEFKPDALMSTHAAVALVDTTYKKHKNAFLYVRQGGLDEVLLADSEEERNDWLAKLNYAAAFRTSGIRMRGVVGANFDGQARRGMRRLDSSDATQLIETPTGTVSIARGYIDRKMAEDIQAARRHGMHQKICEAEKKVEGSQKLLEEQLRNARHLQLLAPIQPRTREQLLLAAARMSAQLRWTRMEIWREKCHRDILIQDLADDEVPLLRSALQSDSQSASSAPHPLLTRLESKPKHQTVDGNSPQTPSENIISQTPSTVSTAVNDIEPPAIPSVPQTPPQSVVQEPRRSKPETTSLRRGSISSIATAAAQPSTPAPRANASQDDEIGSSSRTPETGQDDVDADERDFLRQAGLWEAKSRRASLERTPMSTVTEGTEYSVTTERDRIERSKIRRSLQRTLRESAGHLSHHRSKRGKDTGPPVAGSVDDGIRETTLSRGAGSFVVHGKKASVINLGTELQTMSQEDKIMTRKQHQLLQQDQQEELATPISGNDNPEDDFRSALETPSGSNGTSSRRDSVASTSTATARSFRDLHRRYSSAQAARSVSGGRLAIPSDGESEVSPSVRDEQKSPQSTSEAQREGLEVETCPQMSEGLTLDQKQEGEVSGSDESSSCDEGTRFEHETQSTQPTQVVRL